MTTEAISCMTAATPNATPSATTSDAAPLSVAVMPSEPDVTPGTRAGRRKDRGWVRQAVPPTITFALFIGFWYFMSYVVLKPDRRFLIPPPQQVLSVGVFTWSNFSEILQGLWVTTKVAAVGLGVAIGIGMLLAVAMSQARWVERSLYPYAVVLQTVPILALVPLMGFWFGLGFFSRVIVCVLIAVFPIIANTLFGLQAAERPQRELFLLHGASRLVQLRKLMFPAALPAIFAGLRISAGLSVIGAIVGDFFFRQGDPGLGILIGLYDSRLQSEQLFVAIIVSSLLGIAVFLLFGFISRRAVGAWYESGRGGP